MTKRSLYITILILVVLDLAAGAWWAAGHFNSDGKLRLGTGENTATQADTISDASRPDAFRLLNDSAYYVTQADAAGNCYTCVLHIKAQWPVTVNGNSSVGELKEALIGKLFGKQYGDIMQANDATLSEPHFTSGSTTGVKTSTRPTTKPGRGTEYYYRAYPYMTSDRLLEYHIEHNTYDGYKARRRVARVHYDRVRQQVITTDMVLDLSEKEQIIALLNKRIQHFIDADGMALRHATSLPREFMLGRTGIVFLFPEGEIAKEETGIIEIKLGYDKIMPYLTAYYRDLLAGNNHYQTYPELKIKEKSK